MESLYTNETDLYIYVLSCKLWALLSKAHKSIRARFFPVDKDSSRWKSFYIFGTICNDLWFAYVENWQHFVFYVQFVTECVTQFKVCQQKKSHFLKTMSKSLAWVTTILVEKNLNSFYRIRRYLDKMHESVNKLSRLLSMIIIQMI